MDKQRWQQIQGIFSHLADKSPSHRRDYLEMVCEEDQELRREIEALLASHDRLEQGDRDFITPALITPALQATNLLQDPQTLGEYVILKELGRGGMGVVYLAQHPQHAKVALKLLPRFTVEADQAQQRFTQEARILANLDHPGLCHMVDSFTTDEYAAIAMEFIDGKGLDELINLGPLPFNQGLTIILDLCQVLHLAHTQGLAHRDIKSNNVLLDRQGRTKLIDFGIAKFADVKLTATGQIIGTPGYMSPEQWRGQDVDHHTDLWSLGILLFELLTAQKPFSADERFAVANKILTKEAPPLPATSCDGVDLTSVQAILDQLLVKEPQKRLGSCAELSKLLGKLV
ncbi:MAG: serine/threonine-protein kinase [Candidatus Thiodiazotropha sp.]